MTPFSLLADAGSYQLADVDLRHDDGARQYWLKLFEDHFQQVLEFAKVAYGRNLGKQILSAKQKFAQTIAGLRENPGALNGQLGVMELCRLREDALRSNGIKDPFRHIKQRENRVAIDAYEPVVRGLSRLPADQRWVHLFKGIFAGNIFDLGSSITMGYAKEKVDFDAVLSNVRPRPWKVDHYDEIAKLLPGRMSEPTPWAKAVVFIDNAGADFILGVMPLVREMAAHGTHIVLAANELPSLNDVTADEAVSIVQELAALDGELQSFVTAGLFVVVSTGNDVPLIDLSKVSEELNEASEGADLVLLEGMGRTVESNLHTKFKVDSMQLCLLKDPTIAARVGGEVFDCVCMYEPVAK